MRPLPAGERVVFPIFIIAQALIFFPAAGKPVQAVVASVIRDIVCFIPLICILPHSGGIEGILYAAPAAGGEDAVLKPSRQGVIITIARLVAERLGIPFYYKILNRL